MKAALLAAINQPLEVSYLVAQPLAYGQVYVRILLSGICGAQIQEIRGDKGAHFPRLMGHEGCGIVEAVGDGVTTVTTGDKVVCHWRKGDGIESQSPKYRWLNHNSNEQEISSGQCVTFATHSICSENRLTRVSSDTPDELCCLLGCSLSTAIGTIEQEANLKIGERILIVGCGGLGLNMILAATMRKAGFITAVDIHESKSVAAWNAGAHAFTNRIEDMCGQYSVIIDTSGNEAAINRALEFLAPSGRFIMVGQPKGDVTIRNAKHLFDGEGCTIKATQGGGFRPHIDIPRYARMQIDTNKIISHTVSLENINEGLDLVRNGEAGRVLVRP